MREIINLLESVGLANRKPGDRWQNPQGDEIIFSDLAFYPVSRGALGLLCCADRLPAVSTQRAGGQCLQPRSQPAGTRQISRLCVAGALDQPHIPASLPSPRSRTGRLQPGIGTRFLGSADPSLPGPARRLKR